MKRRKITKVRTTISIDSKVFEESGEYIYNLSAFVEECMRREIAKQKEKKNRDILRISTNKKIEQEIKKDDDYVLINGQYKKSSELTTEDICKMLEAF